MTKKKTNKEETYLEKIERVMKDLKGRGAKALLRAEITDIGIDYYIIARWKTGKKWVIKVVE